MLKVTAHKRKDRFRKTSKLATRFIGPYRNIERLGEVAYKLDLSSDVTLHPRFPCIHAP